MIKVYTEEDFDKFPVVDGIKMCPSGDYSEIKIFPVNCSFENDCVFGNDCIFEDDCR